MSTSAPSFRTSLTIGCTGMLFGALHWIADHSNCTLAVARHATETLQKRPLPGVTAINCDWRMKRSFRSTLTAIDFERLDLALLWVHQSGKANLDWLVHRLAARQCQIVHVLSSAAPDPQSYRRLLPESVQQYRTVKLGAQLTERGWRWLKDGEISAGAVEAIRSGRDVVVGVLR